MSSSAWDLVPVDCLELWRANLPDFDLLLKAATDFDPTLVRGPDKLRADDRIKLDEVVVSRRLPSRDLLERAAWARWPHLVDGLQRACANADVHSAAGVLRTWEDEIEVLERVAPVVRHGSDDARRDVARFLLSRAGGAPFPSTGSPRAAPPDYRQILNNLIHPNRIGHVAVLEPARGEAIRALLLASTEVGRRARRLAGNRGLYASIDVDLGASFADALDSVERFAHESGLPDPDSLTVNFSRLREELSREDLSATLRAIESDLDPLDPAVVKWPRHPASPGGRLRLRLARDHWNRAESIAASGAPDGSLLEYARWLRTLSSATYSTLEVRVEHHREALVRAIASENPLLMSLSARSLLESSAALRYTFLQAHEHLLRVRSSRADGTEVADKFKMVEVQFLRAMAAGATSSPGTALTLRAVEQGATEPPAIDDQLAGAFGGGDAPAAQMVVWRKLSAVVHGQDGALNGSRPDSNRGVKIRALVVLDAALDWDAELRSLHAPVQVGAALDSLVSALSAERDPREEVGHQHVPPYFVAGRDYTGTGTESDPYVLLVGTYIEAYDSLLRHLGLGVGSPRMTVALPDGRVADRVEAGDRVIYIAPRNARGGGPLPE